MQITHLAYLGPASLKTVSGIDFPKDVPVAVTPRQAKSILRYWPTSFVGIAPCPNCPQTAQEPQEAAPEVTPDQSEPDSPPEASEATQTLAEEIFPELCGGPKPKPRRHCRSRKHVEE